MTVHAASNDVETTMMTQVKDCLTGTKTVVAVKVHSDTTIGFILVTEGDRRGKYIHKRAKC